MAVGTVRGRGWTGAIAGVAAIVTSCVLFATSRGDAAKAPVTASAQGLTGVSTADLEALRTATPGTRISGASIVVGGLIRSYLVIAPASATTPLPLLVVLHGSAASVVTEALRDELTLLAEQNRAIIVYPSAYTTDLTWNVDFSSCCQDAGAQHIPDASFIEQLVPVLRAEYHPRTLDLVGFSNGGKLAYDLLCQDSSLFDAAAVVSAVPLQTCTGPPISMMIALGSADIREPLEESPSTVPASVQLDSAIGAWRVRDGCAAAGSTTSQIGVATQTSWLQCVSSTVVSRVLWGGVGHVWPRSNDAGIGTEASAATLVWSFFASLE